MKKRNLLLTISAMGMIAATGIAVGTSSHAAIETKADYSSTSTVKFAGSATNWEINAVTFPDGVTQDGVTTWTLRRSINKYEKFKIVVDSDWKEFDADVITMSVDGAFTVDGGKDNNWMAQTSATWDIAVSLNSGNLSYSLTKVDLVDSGSYVYVKPNANWKLADAQFGAYFYSNSNSNFKAWSIGEQVKDWDAKTYRISVPKISGDSSYLWSNLVLARIKDGEIAEGLYFDDNNSVVWNQSSDLSMSNVGQCFTMTEGNYWDGTGSWSGTAYYSQTAKIFGITGHEEGIDLELEFGERTQYMVEDVEIAENDAVYIAITRNDTTTYYGYEALETGDGSLITTEAVTEGDALDESNHKFNFKSKGEYSLYLKSDGNLWTQVDSDSIASEYADTFLSTFTCSNNAVTAASGTWEELASKWDALVAGAKYIFASAEPNADSESKYDQVIARYKFVIEKYSTDIYSDFMGRGYKKKTAGFFSLAPESSTNAGAIVAVSSLGIVGIVFSIALLLRRKEN